MEDQIKVEADIVVEKITEDKFIITKNRFGRKGEVVDASELELIKKERKVEFKE